jgi:small subunit ribosomal protein S20
LAHSNSARKRIRQNERRRLRNRSRRSELRTQIKKLRQAIEAGKGDEARRIMPETSALIDRLVKTGVIHGNTGARYKSRLAKGLAAI